SIRVGEPLVHAGYPLDAEAVLLVEVEGIREILPHARAAVEEICRHHGARDVRIAHTEEERQALWLGRKAAFGTLGRMAVNYYLHDAAVPRTRLPEVLRRIQEIGRREGLTLVNVFHAGDGNLHPIIIFDARIPGETGRVIRGGEEMLRLCVVDAGKSCGERGIAVVQRNDMPWIYSDADLDAMRRVKEVFDPTQTMNPWKFFPTPVSC